MLAHHTRLSFTSFEGAPSNPGVALKVDALIGEYNRSDVSSVANFFERDHHSQPPHLRETLLCESWLTAKVPFYKPQGPFFCSETFCMLSLSYKVTSNQEKWCTDGTHQNRNSGKDGMSFLKVLLTL